MPTIRQTDLLLLLLLLLLRWLEWIERRRRIPCTQLMTCCHRQEKCVYILYVWTIPDDLCYGHPLPLLLYNSLLIVSPLTSGFWSDKLMERHCIRKTSSPWAVTLSCQHSYMSKMTYKPSKLGQTDLVFGLWSELISRYVLATLQVSTYSGNDLWDRD